MSINVLKLGFPGGTTSGNNLVAIVFCDQTITAPTGWTEFQAGLSGGVHYSASIHTATAAEVTAGTTWNWNLGAFTNLVGYDLIDFANVTGLDTTDFTPVTTANTTFSAPALTASTNELCFAFWVALNETSISPQTIIANPIGSTYARGGLSHSSLIYLAASSGSTGLLTATLGVASTGVSIQASAHGSGSHIASISSGSIS